jgi:ElaB/YqjD/DUF883 family membrane-anchored ribosome-binding protein
LLDEALAFTREGPGAEFTGNLRRSVVHNPLPVALMGIGLAWLMARPGYESRRQDDAFDERDREYDRYPIGVVRGRSLQRVHFAPDDDGLYHHSEFVDDAGRKYRARSDQHGNRAGHFTDEAGKTFRGFMDETGNRLGEFRDETGNVLADATGWASHTWHEAGQGMHDARDRLMSGADDLRSRAARAGGNMQHEAGRLAGTVDSFLHQQPLVGGAIAFAIGAAIGAALPHTREEDEFLGESADAVKETAGREAGHLYDRGKEEAEHLYDEATHSAERAYDKAKGAVGSAVDDMDRRTHN